MENINHQQQQYQPPPNVLITPPSEKRLFKNKISFISSGLLIYSAIMYAVVFGIMFISIFIQGIISGIKNETPDIDAIMNELMETDMGMGIAVILGCLFLLLFNIKRVRPKQIFEKRKPMSISKFIMLVCVLMCIQLPISII